MWLFLSQIVYKIRRKSSRFLVSLLEFCYFYAKNIAKYTASKQFFVCNLKNAKDMTPTRNIALITGATSGIGQATALLFARQGWDIIITGRRHEQLEQVSRQAQSLADIAILPLIFDVRNKQQVTETFTNLPQNWQSIRVLVNNAGLALGRDSFQDANLDDFETMIDTNLKGLIYVAKAVIPLMIAHKKGHIVNIGSTAGKEVYPQGNVYCATKFAVDALGKALRLDLVSHGIRTTNINPGMVETEFSSVRFKGDTQKAATVYQGFTPLSAADIADAIWYAVSRPSHININEITLMPTAQAWQQVVKDKERLDM